MSTTTVDQDKQANQKGAQKGAQKGSEEAARRPGLPIDPRIKERRIAVTRDEGRKRLRILGAVLAAASLAGGAVAATHSALLDVDHVRITGTTHTSQADVLRASGLEGHRFMIDVGAGVAARVGALPWVRSVSVERSWPGTVRIHIVERTPLAVLPADGGTNAVVDSSGRVLADQQLPGLVRIDGVAPAPAPGAEVGPDGKAALAVAAALPADARGRVSSISRDPDGLVLHLRDKGSPIVRFGTDDALGPKIVALTTMLAKLDLSDAAVIDVRVPAAPVLTRRSVGR